MRHRTFVINAILALSVAVGFAALSFLGPVPTLPSAAPSRSNDASATQRQGRGVPANIEIEVGPGEPIDNSEPPLKWERVQGNLVDDPSREGADPYHTWENPQFVMKQPDDFSDLPQAIRDELQRRSCRIPQWTPGTAPHNLLWGEFDHRGQRDVVVLCARERSATVYIFWAGDVRRLEVLPFGGLGSTLSIGTSEDIEGHADPSARTDATMPTTVDHDAISDSCCECCSSYYYRHQGGWFRAPGAD